MPCIDNLHQDCCKKDQKRMLSVEKPWHFWQWEVKEGEEKRWPHVFSVSAVRLKCKISWWRGSGLDSVSSSSVSSSSSIAFWKCKQKHMFHNSHASVTWPSSPFSLCSTGHPLGTVNRQKGVRDEDQTIEMPSFRVKDTMTPVSPEDKVTSVMRTWCVTWTKV